MFQCHSEMLDKWTRPPWRETGLPPGSVGGGRELGEVGVTERIGRQELIADKKSFPLHHKAPQDRGVDSSFLLDLLTLFLLLGL